MALTAATIESGRFGTASIKNESQRLVDTCNSILSMFGGNADYAQYVSGTKMGSEYDTKFRKLAEQVAQINNVCQSLAGKTDSFLDRQEELNNRAV